MSNILAIDPGPKESGFVIYDSEAKKFVQMGIWPNEKLMWTLDYNESRWTFEHEVNFEVIEKIQGMGLAVGADVFETAYWTGIFAHTIGLALISRIPRYQVKMYLCGNVQAKNANIIIALVDRFDPNREFGKYGKGTVKHKGPFYGFRDHMWSAAALAITFDER